MGVLRKHFIYRTMRRPAFDPVPLAWRARVTGAEPASSGLEVQCAVHCATRAFFSCVGNVQTQIHTKKLLLFGPTVLYCDLCVYELKKIIYQIMRRPGIEPGPRAWKARILTIELSTHFCYILLYVI